MWRYSVILFWRLLAASRLSGLMFSRPMKARITPARFALSMKFGMRWQSVSTWMVRLALSPSSSRSLISRSKKLLPVPVAGEIVVGDEEGLDPLREILADDRLEVVGGAEAALAPLDVDDRAEAALERAAAAEIEARPLPASCARAIPCGIQGTGDAGDARQVLEVIVDRLEPAVPGVARTPVEPPLLGTRRRTGSSPCRAPPGFRAGSP